MAQTKEEKLKEKFTELDSDKNGVLDFDELKELLMRGNPNFKSNEVMKLYKKCDTNGDGKISFDEFISYIYGKDKKDGNLNDDSEVDWAGCKLPFEAFCSHGHTDMEGKEFAKFCKDAHLIGKGMAKTDIDLIFAKVVPKGKRRMDFVQFQQACRHIALKRKCQNVEIQNVVMASHGPELHGTKTDAVRFFDDKSTFTGAASHNKTFDGVDPDAHLGRHEKQQEEAAAALKGGVEDDWAGVENVFNQFAGPGAELDGKELIKLADDVHLLGSGLTKQDVDVTFSSVARKSKKIGFEQFKDVVRSFAKKKHKDIAEIQRKIAESDGPVLHATVADYVRFADDKSLYTGSHAAVHGREDGHGDDRHAKMQADRARKTSIDEGERPWDDVKTVFGKFGGEDGLDSKEFAKFCKDAGIIGGKFVMPDVDIIFMSVVPRGTRKIDAEMFCQAIREIAAKKGVPTHEVQGQVTSCEGPVIVGTKGASKFHDDKSLYTGGHALVHGREDGHGGDRHAKMQADHAAKTATDEGERPWDDVKTVFGKFAGDEKGLDGKEFAKFCKDAGIIGGKFVMPDVDIIFTSVVPRGTRKIDVEMFCQAIREIAAKKGVPTHQVQGQVTTCEGPVIVGTKGESKFHDDKSLYTGTHTGK